MCILLLIGILFLKYVSFSLLIVAFKSPMSLLIFCLLLIIEKKVLKYLTIVVDFSISLFNSLGVYFMYFESLLSGE